MKRICLVVAFYLAAVGTSWAQNYQLYGVFMYSFTRYVQWPEDASAGDFEIHVLGDSPILPELRKMAQTKKVGERTIKVSQLTSLSDIKKCNILFVPADKTTQLADVLTKVGEQATLVVTEQTGSAQKGSCINFVEKDGKPAFEINQAALNKQRLKASTELMRFGIVI